MGSPKFLLLLATAIFFLLPRLPLLAQFPPYATAAHLSYVEGTVLFEHSGQSGWSEAGINLPVRSGDRYYLAGDSRAEVALHDGSFLRLGEETQLSFTRISDRDVVLEVSPGNVIIRAGGNISHTVFTPPAVVYVTQSGLYRINVDSLGHARVAVLEGRAQVATRAKRRMLYAGQSLRIDGPHDRLLGVSLRYLEDGLDAWSRRRDMVYASDLSGRYLGRRYAAVYSLYPQGVWVYLPYYARWCWVPGPFSSWPPAIADFSRAEKGVETWVRPDGSLWRVRTITVPGGERGAQGERTLVESPRRWRDARPKSSSTFREILKRRP